ncbi:MAG: hypothetical protein NDI69_16130 [Bacteriovoracaceae bacterium]|nr:hypothetical protein [Bacteriovoracaceae bacterium]
MAYDFLKFACIGCLTLLLTSCAGVKVIHPNQQNKNAGTMALDKDGRSVGTYTCNIVASNGRRVSVIGGSEAEARQEALAKCQDKTLISFCASKNVP